MNTRTTEDTMEIVAAYFPNATQRTLGYTASVLLVMGALLLLVGFGVISI
ncbi:MAG: hypothetical protein ACREQ5_00295 [Candidatus Dormibacteria bacterium]